jgi:hypothetical protein
MASLLTDVTQRGCAATEGGKTPGILVEFEDGNKKPNTKQNTRRARDH